MTATTTDPRFSDFGTPELHKQREIRVGETPNGRRVARVTNQMPIDVMYGKGQITQDQWSAGDRFFRDFTLGGLLGGGSSRMCVSHSVAGSGSAPGWHNDAYIRYRCAGDALDYYPKRVAVNVVCFGASLRNTAIELCIPRPRAREYLDLALDALVAHYRKRLTPKNQ